MLIQGSVANSVPNSRASGQPNAVQLQLGELGVSEILPRYSAVTWSGQTFSVSVAAAAAITAYTGAAAGTPQIAVWNPAGSGKNLWVVFANFGSVVAASAAGTVTWGLYYGPTAAITAAASSTYPVSQATLVPSGSVAKAFVNAALTGSTALSNVIPMGSYYWATAAGATLVTGSVQEIPGYLMIPPGAMVALGGSSALTSATWIGNLIWAELPV
jgi:hypothetical protein